MENVGFFKANEYVEAISGEVFKVLYADADMAALVKLYKDCNSAMHYTGAVKMVSNQKELYDDAVWLKKITDVSIYSKLKLAPLSIKVTF